MTVLCLTITGMAHHPWHYIRDKHPDVTVEFTDSCGQDGCLGRSHGKTIEIDRTSNQRERRGTLTHETHHHERGPVLVLGVRGFEGARLAPKGRSRVTAEDQHDRLFAFVL